MTINRQVPWAIALLAVAVVSPHARQSPAAEPVAWLTGNQLDKRLSRPISIFWTDMPLRRGLTNLSRSQRVAIVLDRRVDADQKIDLTADELPLESALRGLAQPRGLDLRVFGPVIYIGPPKSAAKMRTLAALLKQQTRDCPPAVQRRLLKRRAWQWEDLATPRTLLDELAAEGRFELPDRQRIPHDLWAGAQLPSLTLAERLILVTIQFDLTCQLDDGGAAVRFVPLPERLEIRREYSGGRNAETLAEKWRALLPDRRIDVAGGKIIVHALVEEHELLRGDRRRPSAPVLAEAERVYTLKFEDVPLLALLRQLEGQLSIEVKFDEAALDNAGVAIAQRISLDVKKATLDELLTAALRPAGLKHHRRGNVIEVLPAKR